LQALLTEDQRRPSTRRPSAARSTCCSKRRAATRPDRRQVALSAGRAGRWAGKPDRPRRRRSTITGDRTFSLFGRLSTERPGGARVTFDPLANAIGVRPASTRVRDHADASTTIASPGWSSANTTRTSPISSAGSASSPTSTAIMSSLKGPPEAAEQARACSKTSMPGQGRPSPHARRRRRRDSPEGVAGHAVSRRRAGKGGFGQIITRKRGAGARPQRRAGCLSARAQRHELVFAEGPGRHRQDLAGRRPCGAAARTGRSNG
jgi:hypothetical protein